MCFHISDFFGRFQIYGSSRSRKCENRWKAGLTLPAGVGNTRPAGQQTHTEFAKTEIHTYKNTHNRVCEDKTQEKFSGFDSKSANTMIHKCH